MSMSYYDIAFELAMRKDTEKENEFEEIVKIILIDNDERYVEVDSELVEQAEKVCKANSYLLEDAIERFLSYIVDEEELPFD